MPDSTRYVVLFRATRGPRKGTFVRICGHDTREAAEMQATGLQMFSDRPAARAAIERLYESADVLWGIQSHAKAFREGLPQKQGGG